MSNTTLVIFEDQQHHIPTEIAADDEKLRALFAPYVPAAASAKIEREAGKVTLIKQSGTKGQHTPLKFLQQTPSTLNPAIIMARNLQHLELKGGIPIEDMEALSEEIETAIEQGKQAVFDHRASRKVLQSLSGFPLSKVPLGF